MPFDVKMSHQTYQQGPGVLRPRDGPPENYQGTQPYRMMEIRAGLNGSDGYCAGGLGWAARL